MPRYNVPGNPNYVPPTSPASPASWITPYGPISPAPAPAPYVPPQAPYVPPAGKRKVVKKRPNIPARTPPAPASDWREGYDPWLLTPDVYSPGSSAAAAYNAAAAVQKRQNMAREPYAIPGNPNYVPPTPVWPPGGRGGGPSGPPPVPGPPRQPAPEQRFQPPGGYTPPADGGGGGGGYTPPAPTPPAPGPAEPTEPEGSSWWGADIFGDGWVYLPTAPGEVPTQWQGGEGTKPVGPGWYYLPSVQYFNQLPPQWRDWLGDVVQSQQVNWPDLAISPVQWMPSAQPEQRAPLYMWEPLAGGTPGGQHAIQPPGAPYAPPLLEMRDDLTPGLPGPGLSPGPGWGEPIVGPDGVGPPSTWLAPDLNFVPQPRYGPDGVPPPNISIPTPVNQPPPTYQWPNMEPGRVYAL